MPLEFWEVTARILSIEVTLITAIVTTLILFVALLRSRHWHTMAFFFVMTVWVSFELSIYLDWEIAAQVGLSRYSRELNYLLLAAIGLITIWRSIFGNSEVSN